MMKKFNQIYLLKTALLIALFFSVGSIELAHSANGSDTDSWQEKFFKKPKHWIIRADSPGVESEITIYKVDKVTKLIKLTFANDDEKSVSFMKAEFDDRLILNVEITNVSTTQRNKNVSFRLLGKNRNTGAYDEIPGAKVTFSSPNEGDSKETMFDYSNP